MICSKKSIVISGVLAVVFVTVVLTVAIVFTGQRNSTDAESTGSSIFVSNSLLGKYSKAAVTTNGQECAQIGADMLAKNGSAVDAAIAALICEGIASLHSMGLGGGFLMTIWDAETQAAYFLDARETAPGNATEDMYIGNTTLSQYGGLAVAVPGEILGYWEAHNRFGKLKWSELFEPSIELCYIGSNVTRYLADYLLDREARIKAEPTLAEILINPETNSSWQVGDRIKRPKLAKTLRLIAEQGPDIFYNGTMADDLVAEIQAFGGIITKEDLQNYKVKWKTPIEATIGNLTMYTAPAPGSGVVLTFMMNVLQALIPTNNENVMWQRMIETFKWAYAGRTELGDPDYVNITDVVSNLTSTAYAEEVRGLIRDDWTSSDPTYYRAVTDVVQDSGTAHISVLAPDGSAVSVTSTINQVLGAMMRSNSTGIIFNNEMDDFSVPNTTNAFDLPSSPANYIAPGKRPLSSMSPTIVLGENKQPQLVIGAAGGSKITTAIATAMVFNLWLGYDVKESVDARRIHHQLIPMNVQNEIEFPQSILDALHEIGHDVKEYSGIGSAVTAVAVKDGIVTANSDFRREGRTAGF